MSHQNVTTASLAADGRITQQDFEQRRNSLDADIERIERALTDGDWQPLDFDELLAYAEKALCNVAELWERLPLDGKQRLQRILWPGGLIFDGKNCQTLEKSPVFSVLSIVSGE